MAFTVLRACGGEGKKVLRQSDHGHTFSNTSADQAAGPAAEPGCHSGPILWHVFQPGAIAPSSHLSPKQQHQLGNRCANVGLWRTLQVHASQGANGNSEGQTFSGIRDVWAKASVKCICRVESITSHKIRMRY